MDPGVFTRTEPGAFSNLAIERATEEITACFLNRQNQTATFYQNGEPVGFREWLETGVLIIELTYRNQRWHGSERRWHDDGRLYHVSFFVDGFEHGVSHQYDEDGSLMGTYSMQRGTGLDRWFQKAGFLAEERQFVNGEKHGYERWYDEPSEDRTIWQEDHYKSGVNHGIFREWNAKGRLRRGFPQYFVNGEKVTKRRYGTAQKHDPFLPQFRAIDNDPHREPLPF